MSATRQTRRQFMKSWAGTLAAGAVTPRVFAADSKEPTKSRSKNDRLGLGAIGMKYRGTIITRKALPWADVVAICDVDREIAEKARADFGGKADLYEDYRKMLERKDVDVVLIATPDHWHTAMAIAACRAGKDVYCEKPLTLTIDEGKRLGTVVKETGCVVQVGSWQRSDERFRLACEMVRAGRLGKLQKVTVTIAPNPTGGPFKNEPPPSNLNWDLWLGQTPLVPYCKERCHYTFRWWFEYSGGQMTDWGAHNLDIALWGMGRDRTGPVEIEGQARFPSVENGYNVPPWYEARLTYAGGLEMHIGCEGKVGVLFEGDAGSILATRDSIESKPAELLKDHSLRREQFRLYAHDNLDRASEAGNLNATLNHVGNFFDCVKSRRTPISDVVSQHRSVSACHLANISMRLGRRLKWDPEKELFIGDDEANGWLSRPQRKSYQL